MAALFGHRHGFAQHLQHQFGLSPQLPDPRGEKQRKLHHQRIAKFSSHANGVGDQFHRANRVPEEPENPGVLEITADAGIEPRRQHERGVIARMVERAAPLQVFVRVAQTVAAMPVERPVAPFGPHPRRRHRNRFGEPRHLNGDIRRDGKLRANEMERADRAEDGIPLLLRADAITDLAGAAIQILELRRAITLDRLQRNHERHQVRELARRQLRGLRQRLEHFEPFSRQERRFAIRKNLPRAIRGDQVILGRATEVSSRFEERCQLQRARGGPIS